MGRIAARLSAAMAAFAYFFLQLELLPRRVWSVTLPLSTLLFVKTVLAHSHRPRRVARTRHLSAALVLPFYNETDEALARTFSSITRQTRAPDELHIVNDGSPIGGEAVELWIPILRERIPTVVYHTKVRNGGKRRALWTAFSSTECDLLITTDSDCELLPTAVEEIIKPFASDQVTGVTGRIAARNRERNLLTRVQDILYAAAFLNTRAAYSMLGSVLVCSGALAAFRRTAILPNMENFLRHPWMFGEDRQLTSFALLHGRVLLQETAVAASDVPETFTHYVRQQVRWQRAFIQNTIWVLRKFPMSHRVFWVCFFGSSLWLIFIVLVPLFIARGNWLEIVTSGYILYSALLSWTHLSRYLEIKGEGKAPGRFARYLIAPVIGPPYALFITCVRVYAVFTFNVLGHKSRRRAAAQT